MKQRKLHATRGTTIIELLVYMGILSILLTIFMNLFASAVDTQLRSESLSAVEQDTLYITQRLKYDIHRASSITIPAAVGATTNTLSLDISGTTYTYALNGSSLTITDASGSENLNGVFTQVSNLSFERLGTDTSQKNTIQINFTLTSTSQAQSGPETKNVETTIGIR